MRRFASYWSRWPRSIIPRDLAASGSGDQLRWCSAQAAASTSVDVAVLHCAGLQPHGLLARLQEAAGCAVKAAPEPPPELRDAIEQLRQMELSADELGSAQQLLAKLASLAGSSEAASRSYQLLLQQRQQAALAGSPAVLGSLTPMEVQALSGVQVRQLHALLHGMEQRGRQLAAELTQQRALQAALQLSPGDLNALAWHLRTQPADAQQQLLHSLAAWRDGSSSSPPSSLAAAAQQRAQAVQALRGNIAIEEELASLSGLVTPRLLGGELLDPSLQAQLEAAAAQAAEQQQQQQQFVEQVRQLDRALAGQQQVGMTLPGSTPQLLQEVQAQLAMAPPLLQQLLGDALGPAPASAAELGQYQQRASALLEALQQELQGEGADSAGSTPPPFWLPEMSLHEAGGMRGLMQVLGERGPKVAELARSLSAAPQAQRLPADTAFEDESGQFQMYEALEELHGQQDVQRYLQMEFDPVLQVNTCSAPRPWLDPEAARLGEEAFLEGLRPQLEAHLQAHGAAPLEDAEWEVYKAAAIDDFARERAQQEAGLRRDGASGFFNARAEEAYLRTRLAAGLPQGSVLHAAGHKYLAAVLRNPTWTFAKRLALVERLVELAGQLGKVPTRVKGSPYSAMFAGKVPLAPRLSRRRRAPQPEHGAGYTLPPQFQAVAAGAESQ